MTNKLPLFHKGESGKIHFAGHKRLSSQIFLYTYISLVLILFLILTLRLFQLTIVKGDYYRRLSEENRIRELLIEPKRGKIIDRKGFIIAENIEANTNKNTDRLTSDRLYHTTEAVAHLIGYRQKADKDDMKNDSCLYKLKIGDKLGKKGVEKVFECQLRGKHGKKLIEVDVKGAYLRTLSLFPPTDGETTQIALDLELQKKAYEIIKDKKATIVGIKPQTGEIIILISTPSFNPQEFEDENEIVTSLYLKGEEKPLFNRVTEGAYAPGSIFKLVLAAGALEENKIDEKTLIEDTGILKAGPITFGNWYFLQYGKTDGMVDIVKAIRRSNDIFFYRTGGLLTPEKIKKWAEILGYGTKTEVGLEETVGLVPSPFWKDETLKESWYLGDTYNFSIGQGYLLVTPLQVTMATAAFANGGYLCKPQLLKVETGHAPSLQQCKKLPISQKTLDLVREGMKEACSPGGTGWPLFDFKPQVGCKTGTAESQSKDTLPHAWFTVFAPYDNPEIALTVLVEESGQGSDIAAPIAKEILKTYFERNE
ncbi:hypothetical protein HY612_02135 [Candidatus Roizmanbacteria bacterium]|nr:hypothetical protein [Candidatus Roizmanbacteria bacterium]